MNKPRMCFVLTTCTPCAICQEDICSTSDDYVRLAECCHPFHADCLDAWMHCEHPASHTCPCCRMSTDEQRQMIGFPTLNRVRRKLIF